MPGSSRRQARKPRGKNRPEGHRGDPMPSRGSITILKTRVFALAVVGILTVHVHFVTSGIALTATDSRSAGTQRILPWVGFGRHGSLDRAERVRALGAIVRFWVCSRGQIHEQETFAVRAGPLPRYGITGRTHCPLEDWLRLRSSFKTWGARRRDDQEGAHRDHSGSRRRDAQSADHVQRDSASTCGGGFAGGNREHHVPRQSNRYSHAVANDLGQPRVRGQRGHIDSNIPAWRLLELFRQIHGRRHVRPWRRGSPRAAPETPSP